jgi:methionyl-tRNA formyltransferase
MNSLVLACSGLLGHKVLKYLYVRENINAVLTDKKSIDIINFCNQYMIPYFAGNIRYEVGYEFVKNYQNNILLSINYIFLFDQRTINLFVHKFNVHGSLLPKYRGRTPHVWAIINNEKKAGITIHEITLECDAGDVFLQREVPIAYSDTGGIILEKYFYHYPKLVEQFLQLFREQKLLPRKQEHDLATYFDKREPEDGKIDWNWQWERIYNWVRALAPPYPGAFSYLDNNKIIINKISFSDFGFFQKTANGTIIAYIKNGFIVKTPNGCIEVSNYIVNNNILINIGDVLT